MSGPIQYVPARPRRGGKPATAVVTCGTCEGNFSLTVGFGQDGQAKRRFQNAGWHFVGSKATCPECQEAARKASQEAAKQREIEVAKVKEVTNEKAQAEEPKERTPSKAAREIRRNVIELLHGCYDTGAERYTGDADDALIAQEAGCAETLVAQIRVDLFGEGSGNEAQAQSLAALGKALDKLTAAADEAMNAAEAAMKAADNVTALKKDYEKLRKALG